MQNRTVVNAPRNLPMPVVSEVERMGYGLLRGLDRLGFTHEDKNGEIFTVRFSHVALYGEAWASFTVDAERLWHFSVADLSKPPVLAQLSAVVKRPVRAETSAGLTFAIEINPRPKVRLPDCVALDLSDRTIDGGRGDRAPTTVCRDDLLVPVGVGRGGAMWRDLADIGHALIVGTTGSGKSTWIHSALASLFTTCESDVLRVALIDPKRSEFTAWAGAPHLLADIAHDETQATKLLGDLVIEIDRRGDLLAGALARDLDAYNERVAEPLPYILCVIDECLDMVLGGDKELLGALKTIAIRGRSAGVFLWAATQHAAAITGMPRVVNTNLTTRLVFRVADQSAALAAGCPGAESLPRERPGRMLAKVDGKPQELQAFYLSDKDLLNVAQTVSGGRVVEPVVDDEEAELLTWARDRNGGYLSIADVQRKRRVGYTEARRVTEALESRGLLEKDKAKSNRRRITGKARESLTV